MPPSGTWTNLSTAILSGRITDENPLELTLDGHPVAVVDGAFSVDAPMASDQDYVYHFVATDAAGNQTEAEVIVRRDATSPVVQVSQPEDDSFVSASEVNIEGTVQEPNFASLLIGQQAVAVVDGAFSATTTIQSGSNEIRIVATDQAGNSTTTTLHVTLDDEEPLVALVSPKAGGFTNEIRPLIRLTYEDALSGIDTDSVQLVFNGSDTTSLFDVTATEATYQPPAGSDLQDGMYLIQATLQDRAGNSVTTSPFFFVDTIPPTAGFTPADGATVTEAAPRIEISYSDTGAGVCPCSVKVQLDGVDVTELCEIDAASAVYQVPTTTPLTDGNHTVEIDFSDKARNHVTASSTFMVETEPVTHNPPIVKILSPEPGTQFLQPRVKIRVKVTAESALPHFYIYLNDQVLQYTRENDEYVAEGLIDDELCFIVATATDEFGLNGFDLVVVFYNQPEATPDVTPDSGYAQGTVIDYVTKSPLPNARVSMHEIAGAVYTDEDGEFAFPLHQMPREGDGLFRMDVSADGHQAAQRDVRVNLRRGVAVGEIQLMPLDSYVTTIGPEGGVAVNSDGKIRVEIPAGALPYPIDVVATYLPGDEALPGPLPKTSHYTVAVDLKPDGISFESPVTLKVANHLDIAPGTPVPVGYYDSSRRLWEPMENGVISDDGQWMVAHINHFSPYDLNFPIFYTTTPPPDFLGDESGDERDAECESGDCFASKVSHKFGSLQVWKELVDVLVHGRKSNLTLVYNSEHAQPKAFVDVRVNPGTTSTVSGTMKFAGLTRNFKFAGRERESSFRYVLPGYSRRGLAYEWLETGFYEYAYDMGFLVPVEYGRAPSFGAYPTEPPEGGSAVLSNSSGTPIQTEQRVSQKGNGFVPLINRRESPFGAGWTLAGLSRLIPGARPTDPLLLDDGAGNLVKFEKKVVKPITLPQLHGLVPIEPEVGGDDDDDDDDDDEYPGDDDGGYYDDDDDSGDAGNELTNEAGRASVMATDPKGRLIFVRWDGWSGFGRIYRVENDGTLVHLAGVEGGDYNDGIPATAAAIDHASGLAADGEGNVYVTQPGLQVVRKIDPDGIITTIAGRYNVRSNSGDDGPADAATLFNPGPITADLNGNLFIQSNKLVRQIDAAGVIRTIAGGENNTTVPSYDPVNARDLSFNNIVSLATDRGGNLYIAKELPGSVIRVNPSGSAQIIAGGPSATSTLPSGSATAIKIKPSQVGVTLSGDIVMLNTRDVYYEPEIGWWYGNPLLQICSNGRIETIKTSQPLYSTHHQLAVAGNAWYLSGEYENSIETGEPEGFEYVSISHPQSRIIKSRMDGTYQRIFKTGEVHDFDAAGNLARTRDTNGNVETYEYDAEGRLQAWINVAGGRTSLYYDYDGRIAEIRHPQGISTRFDADSNGDLVAITDPDGTRTEYQYDEQHLLKKKISFRGAWVDYQYNGKGQITATIRSNGEGRLYNVDASQGLVVNASAGTPLPTPDSILTSVSNSQGHTRTYRLNAGGAALQSTDELGNTLYTTYNTFNLPIEIIYPTGRIQTFTYDNNGNLLSRHEIATDAIHSYRYDGVFNKLISSTDAKGNITSFGRNDHGDVVQITEPTGAVTHIFYNSIGLPDRIVNPRGNETTMLYDNLGNLAKMTDSLGNATLFLRDSTGYISTIRNALGKEEHYQHNEMNRTVSITNAKGNTTRFSYRPVECSTCGNLSRVTSITDALDNTTTFDYDQMGRMTQESDSLGAYRRWVFDSAGNLTQFIDKDSRTTNYGYDARGDLVSMIAPAGGTWQYERDEIRNIKATIDPMSRRTQYDYDLSGRLQRVRRFDGIETNDVHYEYDKCNNVTAFRDQLGQTTYFTYDAANRPVSTVDELGYVTSRTYDEVGNLSRLTKPNQGNISYLYDEINRLTQRKDRLGNTITLDYDAVGNVVAKVDESGNSLQYSYDENNQLVSVATQNGIVVSLTLDDKGRWTSIHSSDGTHIERSLDCLNRPTSVSYPDLGRCLNYEYYPSGRRKVLIINNTNTSSQYAIHYSWDDNGRLSQVAHDQIGSASFAYYADDALAQILYPNSVTANYDYDQLRRLKNIHYNSSSGSTITKYQYDYDSAGNVSIISHDGDVTRFEYDARSALTKATYHDGTWEYYGYDADNNRIRKEDPNGLSEYQYDASDRLLNVLGDQSSQFVWNADGTLARETGPFGAREFSWDAFKRLKGVACSGETTIEYRYLPLSKLRCSMRTTSGQDKFFLWDQEDVIEELDASGNTTSGYLRSYLNYDSLLGCSYNGSIYSYLTVANGSVTGLLDGFGSVVNEYAYSPFGEFKATYATVNSPNRPFGRDWDEASNLVYFRARYYDPRLGQFISRDPNFPYEPSYLMARNNPLRYADPTGEEAGTLVLGYGLIETGSGAGLTAILGPALAGTLIVGSGLVATYYLVEYYKNIPPENAPVPYENGGGECTKSDGPKLPAPNDGGGLPPVPIDWKTVQLLDRLARQLEQVSNPARPVIQVTENGVALTPDGNHDIPAHYEQNKNRPGSYGVRGEDGRYKEKLRIDSETNSTKDTEQGGHYHLDGGEEHYGPGPGSKWEGDPGFGGGGASQ